MYCLNCNLLTDQSRCPNCGNKHLLSPEPQDFCRLAELDVLWQEAMSDILTENGIPFITKNLVGTAMTACLGAAQEQVRFYVPYAHLETAKELHRGFFEAEIEFDMES